MIWAVVFRNEETGAESENWYWRRSAAERCVKRFEARDPDLDINDSWKATVRRR